jgi:hypothetical protein
LFRNQMLLASNIALRIDLWYFNIPWSLRWVPSPCKCVRSLENPRWCQNIMFGLSFIDVSISLLHSTTLVL